MNQTFLKQLLTHLIEIEIDPFTNPVGATGLRKALNFLSSHIDELELTQPKDDGFALLAGAMERYRRGELSAGEAAQTANVSKSEFLRRRGEFGVMAIKDRSEAELETELQKALEGDPK